MSLQENLAEIEERIVSAASSAGRSREEITLIAVSKTVDIELLRDAYELGIREFGESRLQEALPKIAALPADVRWHFVGALQSNKARRTAENFSLIHSLGTASALGEIAKAQTNAEVLIEVNIGEESQKSGIFPKLLDEFAKTVLHCDQVHLRGLMTVGPAEEPEAMRPYFRKMREMKEALGLPILSMGMSSDFDVAIQEGATHIRVGTALFGARRRRTED